MNMLSDREFDASERGRLLARAISRWNNEGGAGDGGRVPPASAELLPDALPLTGAELVQFPDDPRGGPDDRSHRKICNLCNLQSAAASVGDPPLGGQVHAIGSAD
jgi:hypothetical protein